MTPPDHHRLAFIDALRGFAILMVIANHAGSLTQPGGAAGRLAEFFGYGVQLFFVISAFTIFLTFERSQRSERSPTANFFTRRLLRIVPVYWFGIVLYVTFFGLGSRGWLPGPELWHFPVHAVLLNSLHPEVQSSVVPGGWSISCEVLFYLTVPLWFRVIRSLRAAVVFLIATMAIGPLVTWGARRALAAQLASFDPSMLTYFWYRLLPNQLACFAAGILLYFVWKERRAMILVLERPLLNLLWLAGAAGLVAAAAVLHPKYPAYHHLYAVGFAGLAIALAAIPWRAVVNVVTIFVGRISYSGYIVHFLVLKALTALFEFGSGWVAFASLTVAAWVCTVPLAWVVYRTIELPSMSLAKQLVRRRETAGGSAAWGSRDRRARPQ